MNTYTNNDVTDPHGFKEQAKIKYEATKAIVGRFQNGTATLMHLLSNAEPALDWDDYCALPAARRLEWETKADTLTQGIIFITNKRKRMTKNLTKRITQRLVPLGLTLRTVQQVKTTPLLAEKPT